MTLLIRIAGVSGLGFAKPEAPPPMITPPGFKILESIDLSRASSPLNSILSALADPDQGTATEVSLLLAGARPE